MTVVERFLNQKLLQSPVTRKRAIRVLVGGAAATLSACGQGDNPQPTKPAEVPHIEGTPWASFSNAERINRLERRQFPETITDPIRELAVATSGFLCEQKACEDSPEAMADRIRIVDPQEIITVRENEEGRFLSEEEKAGELTTRVLYTTPDKRIYISQPAVDLAAKQATQLKDFLGEHDPRMVMYKSVILRGLINTELAQFNTEVNTILASGQDSLTLERMHDFVYTTHAQNGSVEEFEGTKAAVAEEAAQIIGNRAGRYVSQDQFSYNGSVAIHEINELTNVEENTFLNYALGVKPIDGYLDAIAHKANRRQPNHSTAHTALYYAGLAAIGRITRQDADAVIHQILNVPQGQLS